MAEALNIPRDGHKLLWVVDFPMFKYDEETKKYAAEHHPFTMILKSDWDKIETDPYGVRQLQLRHRHGWLWRLVAAPFVFTTPSCRSAF